MFVNTHLRSGKWFLVWTQQAKTRYFIILLFIKTMLSNATYERTVKLFHLSNMKTKPAMIPFRFKDSKKKKQKQLFVKERNLHWHPFCQRSTGQSAQLKTLAPATHTYRPFWVFLLEESWWKLEQNSCLAE